MKTDNTFKVPAWHDCATAMLTAISDGRKPPLDEETKAQIAAEIAGIWAKTSAEASVSPDEAAAMAEAHDDLLAADASGHAMPEWPVDISLTLMPVRPQGRTAYLCPLRIFAQPCRADRCPIRPWHGGLRCTRLVMR